MKKILLSLLFIASSAFAWEPTKPVTVIIGYSPGSSNEIIFRKAAEIVTNNNPKVNFIIESRPGASGVIANNHLVSQPANGYYIGVPSTTTTAVANDIWQNDIKKYSWQNLVTPVVLGETSMALIATNSSTVNTLQEFNELLKRPTRNINIATAGGTQTIAYYYLLDSARADDKVITEIKYGNSSQVSIAVVGGQPEFGITAINSAEELAKGNKLKILTTTANPNFYITNGYMIVLPEGTPVDVVKWYETEFGRAIRTKEFHNWAAANYITVNSNLTTDKVVKAYLVSLRDKFAKIINVVKSKKE